MDIGRAITRGVIGGIGGVGEGLASTSKTGFEQEVLKLREENIARFKAKIEGEALVAKEGMEDYAVGKDGSVLTRAQYNELAPEEKANYKSLVSLKEGREQLRADAAARTASASERRADASEKSAEAAMRRSERGAEVKPPTEAEKQKNKLSLRKDAANILERAGLGEDVKAEVDWYNEEAAALGLPLLGQTQKVIPGKKGLFRDSPDTTETSWGYVGKEPASPPAPPAATVKTEPTAKPPAGMPSTARQARDGKWYSPDPDRPGKYILEGGVKTPEQPAKEVGAPEKSNMTPEQRAAADRAAGKGAPLLSRNPALAVNNERVIREAAETKEKVRAGTAAKESSAEQKEVARLREIADTLKAKKARGALSTGKDQADYEKAISLGLITEPTRRR